MCQPSYSWWFKEQAWVSYLSPLLFFPGGSDGKESACNVEDLSSIPGWGRSPREGNGNPSSCLENPMDRGTWHATAHGVARARHNLASKPPALLFNRISQVVQWKRIHLPAGDVGLIPESGRSLEKEMAIHSSILAGKIPWTEESCGLQSMGRKESDMTEHWTTLFNKHLSIFISCLS